MILDELKALLVKEKLECYEYLRDVSRLSRQELDNAGYKGKSNAEALKMILDEHIQKVERMVQKWERENP